ncbi:MAG: hypothetical protein N2595_11030 [bacterium]|nr:hypothetical protein [bacterium]
MSTGRRHSRVLRGVTLIEAVICALLLAVGVLSVLQGLTFGYGLARQATRESLGALRVTQRLEEILLTPYEAVTAARYPIEYVTATQRTEVTLIWAMTTMVTEVAAPVRYKLIRVEATWGEGKRQRYSLYTLIRAPVEMRAPYLPRE